MMQWGRKILRVSRCTFASLGLIGWIWPGAGAAADEAADPPKVISLDQLMKLPDSLQVETLRRGSYTRAEWHARFIAAEGEVLAAEAAVEEAMGEVEELAGQTSNWKMASPLADVGASEEDNAPLNYGLKQKIRRGRIEVERSERALLELEIEANLASVPEEWRRPPVIADEVTPLSIRSELPPAPWTCGSAQEADSRQWAGFAVPGRPSAEQRSQPPAGCPGNRRPSERRSP